MSDNSQQPARPGDGKGEQGASREAQQPAVDAAAAVFGRPPGVEGAFDTRQRDDSAAAQPSRPAQPPASLVEAFSRDTADAGVVLQRPPGGDIPDGASGNGADPLWSSATDPWRNPGSGAVLGTPALAQDADEPEEQPKQQERVFSLAEVIFGGRLRTSALVILAVAVLIVGALGGTLGWFLAQQGNQLTRDVTLAQVDEAVERPPGSVAGTVAKVAPAVVSIEVTSGQSGGVGSGVVIDRDGYIVTNDHVVASAQADDDAEITAVFTDGSRATAKLVGSDPKTDLAVLKVNVRNPTVLQLGKSEQLQPGDTVIAVGSPFGLENTVTVGIVSAVNRPVTAPAETGGEQVTYDAIQTDAAINPGNSGGALVDKNGLLVGVNSLIRTVGNARGQGGSIGLGFAIPVDDVVKIAESLIANGSVSHAFLGVSAASVAANSSRGARVNNVAPGGPAQEAGIKEGDVIVQVGDRTVRNAAELTVAVRKHDVGEVTRVKLVRGGRELVVDVKLGSD
ncbi:S1C family serine protease [Haloechinothrix halophila]|uniref:S1C family serine protease n=1 Tax=Haloechinothrix halophila TaxID=1069073 RepID=UPI0003F767CD|nr:trypsin-like peptidase domain-containing protein [Haloechinothrix halophila]